MNADQCTERPEFGTSWQELLCQIDGVYSVYIAWGEGDAPSEIHVLASDRKPPKAIIRDIQSALAAAFHVQVDYRIISVAQIPPPMLPGGSLRLKHDGLSVTTHGTHVEVQVSLAFCNDVKTGQGVCTTAPASRARGVAQATLGAIAGVTGAPERYELMSIEAAAAGGQPVWLAVIHDLHTDRRLLGSAFAAPDADSAAVRAVLNALNRQLEQQLEH